MNIVFLIGNGFDLQMGLKTSYHDFLVWYLDQPDDNAEIIEFKNNIDQEFELWGDFELQLGKYTTHFTEPNDFLTVYDDIIIQLSTYLKKEQDLFLKQNTFTAEKFCRQLCLPEEFLIRRDQQFLNDYKNQFKNEFQTTVHDVKILTFNYTTIISHLISQALPNRIFLGPLCQYKFDPVLHVHGTLSKNNMILGVNDVDQLDNKIFSENDDVKDCLVKPQANHAAGFSNDTDSKVAIETANLICLYGLSLGKTDLHWWTLITNRMHKSEKVRLIIFYKDKDTIPPVTASRKESKRREIKNRFIEMTNADAKIKDRIFVAYDSDIFKSGILSSK